MVLVVSLAQHDLWRLAPLGGLAAPADVLDRASCDVGDALHVRVVEAALAVDDENELGIVDALTAFVAAVAAAEPVRIAVPFPFLALSQPPLRSDRVLLRILSLLPLLDAQVPGIACASGHDRDGESNELQALPTCDP